MKQSSADADVVDIDDALAGEAVGNQFKADATAWGDASGSLVSPC